MNEHGVYKGNKFLMEVERNKKLHDGCIDASAIAKGLRITPEPIYRRATAEWFYSTPFVFRANTLIEAAQYSLISTFPLLLIFTSNLITPKETNDNKAKYRRISRHVSKSTNSPQTMRWSQNIKAAMNKDEMPNGSKTNPKKNISMITMDNPNITQT